MSIKSFQNRIRSLYRIIIKPILIRRPILFFYKKTGLKVVTRDDLLINSCEYHVQEFYTRELAIAGKPHLAKVTSEAQAKLKPFAVTIDKPFICEIANAKLAGPAAVGFDENGSIILETTTPFYSRENHLEGSVSIRSLALKNIKSSNTLDIACSLVNAWSLNYWHWMIDCLTRLEGVEYYCKTTGKKPIIIIDSNPTSWQVESLKLLGYKSDDFFEWNKSVIQVEKLIISSFRRHYDQVYSIESPSACRWLRQRMLSNLDQDWDYNITSSRVIISRRQAGSRKILNEDSVIRTLSTLGFVAYVLEDMSFLEQVRLFAYAKVIVAPHGAGLTNIIFSQNLTVIELFGSSLPPCFANLSRSLGFRYGCIKCQSPHTGIRRQDSDMLVDVGELKSFVLKMLE